LVVPEDPEEPCWFHIADYKTARAFGTYRIKLSADSEHARFVEDIPLLNQIIRAWKEKQSDMVRTRKSYRNPRGLVLPNAAGKTDDGRFQRIIKEAIKKDTGKTIGIRQIRRIYATHLSLGPPMSTADKEAVAFMMGHSMQQSDTYRIIDEATRQYNEAQRDRDETREELGRSDRQLDALQEMVDELQTSIPQLQNENARYIRALRDILRAAHDAINE
jgi:integrase